MLGRDLTPEFEVTSGKRRLSEQQLAPLRCAGNRAHPEWSRPRKVECLLGRAADGSGRAQQQLDLPRKPEEIRRAWATYHASGCQVKTRRRARSR